MRSSLVCILLPFDSHQFVLWPWAASLFQKLCPIPELVLTPGQWVVCPGEGAASPCPSSRPESGGQLCCGPGGWRAARLEGAPGCRSGRRPCPRARLAPVAMGQAGALVHGSLWRPGWSVTVLVRAPCPRPSGEGPAPRPQPVRMGPRAPGQAAVLSSPTHGGPCHRGRQTLPRCQSLPEVACLRALSRGQDPTGSRLVNRRRPGQREHNAESSPACFPSFLRTLSWGVVAAGQPW